MILQASLCLLLGALPLAAQAPAAAPAPSRPDIEALKARYPLAETAYLRWEASFDEEAPGFLKPVKEHTERAFRASLVLRTGRNVTRTFAPPVPSGSTLAEAAVSWTLPDGRTERQSLEQFGTRTVGVESRRVFTYPPLPEGTRIEESYTAKVPGLVQGSLMPLPREACFQSCRLEFVLPAASSFKLKNPLAGTGRGQVSVGEHPSGRKVWTLELRDFGPEPLSPLSLLALPPAALAWERVFYPTYLLTPGQSVGTFHRKVASRKPWVSTAVEDTALGITRGVVGARSQAQAIYAFLQGEIKVLNKEDDKGGGLFGNAPLDFADMLKEKKGSADGIAALMHLMLAKVGVPSRLVLIHRSATGEFDPEYLEPRDSFEVAVWLELDGVPTLAQPQHAGRPLGQLGAAQMDRPAIVVRDESSLEVLRTPAFLPVENRYEDAWTLEVSEKGTGKIRFERAASGPEAQEMRELWKNLPEWRRSDRKALFDLFPASPFGSPAAAALEGVEAPGAPLRLAADLELPVVCRLKDGVVWLNPMAAAFMFSPFHGAPARDLPRKDPLWVPYNQVTRRTLRIKVPPAWKLQTPLPEPQQARNFLGSASARYSMEGDVIRVDQELSLVAGLHSPVYGEALLRLAGEKSPLALPAFRFLPGPPAAK